MDGALAIGGETARRPAAIPLGLGGSAALHLALLAVLFTLTPLRSFVAPEPPAISVELVAPSELQPSEPQPAARAAPSPLASAPAADTEPTAGPPAQVPSGAPRVDADGVFHATTLYAAGLLQQASMAQVRRSLGTLDPGERVNQLCAIEALEQIRLAAPQYAPDTLVSYAMSDPVTSGLMISAMGGAFRSRRQWFGLAFECTAAANLSGVASFSFRLGDPIPETEWEEHNLNAEDKVE